MIQGSTSARRPPAREHARRLAEEVGGRGEVVQHVEPHHGVDAGRGEGKPAGIGGQGVPGRRVEVGRDPAQVGAAGARFRPQEARARPHLEHARAAAARPRAARRTTGRTRGRGPASTAHRRRCSCSRSRLTTTSPRCRPPAAGPGPTRRPGTRRPSASDRAAPTDTRPRPVHEVHDVVPGGQRDRAERRVRAQHRLLHAVDEGTPARRRSLRRRAGDPVRRAVPPPAAGRAGEPRAAPRRGRPGSVPARCPRAARSRARGSKPGSSSAR